MMINDEIIIKLFFISQDKNRFLRNRFNKYFNDEIKEYLDNRFLEKSRNYIEDIFRIKFGYEEIPKCPICGNLCVFVGHGKLVYRKYCENKQCQYIGAANTEKSTLLQKYGDPTYRNIEKSKKTCLNKYGVEYSWQATEVKDNIKKSLMNHYGVDNAFKSDEIKDKIKNTLLERYNVDNIFKDPKIIEQIQEKRNLKIPEIIKKSKHTCANRYGDENYRNVNKNKQTCLEKYGVECTLQLDEVKNKAKQTCLEKYGVEYFTQSKEYKDLISTEEVQSKRKQNEYNTKKLHNSFNKSIPEDIAYKIILEKYPDVIRQYRSNRYPFNCDFYIPSKDLYIECNFHWTHGGHPYDPNSLEDLQTLNKWKEKNSQFYNNAIKTWTILDVNKCNVAKENNLNYIVVYKLSELNDTL